MTKLPKLRERHLLFEPRFLEVFEKYKPGEPLDCSKLYLSKISWPPEAVGEIHEFIRKGYLNILVQLLKKHPIAIAHQLSTKLWLNNGKRRLKWIC